MAKYEVYIPAANAGEFNVTLKVDADNWMAALKTGLTRLGEAGAQVVNLMVDIMEDNSIHVTDSASGRVFRIIELAQDAAPPPASAAPRPASPSASAPSASASTPDRPVAPPAEPDPAAAASVAPIAPAPVVEQRPPFQPPASPVPAAAPVALAPEQRPTLQSPASPVPAALPIVPIPEQRPAFQPPASAVPAAAPVTPAPAPKPSPELRPSAPTAAPPERSTLPAPAAMPAPQAARHGGPTPVVPPAQPVAKPIAAPSAETAPRQRRSPSTEPHRVEQVERPSQPITGRIGRVQKHVGLEDVLSDLFERTQEVYGLDREKGLGFLLDLALEKISAEAGSVFVARLGDSDLALLSVRGPKASALQKMQLRMPMGVGVVGFCAQEAVSLAISDTEKDPRFYREVSEKIGYSASSILCAPMVSAGRSFGCIELINRRGSSTFTDSELAILSYVAHQGARFLESLTG